jgi:hypothetical protein
MSGDPVSGSRPPRFSPEAVEAAISALAERIKAASQDASAGFRVTKAVVFGDFLAGRTRVQAADVGVQLSPREPARAVEDSAIEKAAEREFLRQLKGKSALLNIRPYDEWIVPGVTAGWFSLSPASCLTSRRQERPSAAIHRELANIESWEIGLEDPEMVQFQHRYQTRNRIFSKPFHRIHLPHFCDSKKRPILRSQLGGLPTQAKSLKAKDLWKALCRIWYLCWNLTYMEVDPRSGRGALGRAAPWRPRRRVSEWQRVAR